ncbi:MAG: hypothetical protein ACLQVI_14435 [Polyangiaceae bacterium]|jgi:hypothetical protein
MTTEPESTKSHADWNKAKPDVIPRPTYWPAAMAFGLTLLLWGLVTSPVVLGVGFSVIVVSLIGWIGEMRHEQ